MICFFKPYVWGWCPLKYENLRDQGALSFPGNGNLQSLYLVDRFLILLRTWRFRSQERDLRGCRSRCPTQRWAWKMAVNPQVLLLWSVSLAFCKFHCRFPLERRGSMSLTLGVIFLFLTFTCFKLTVALSPSLLSPCQELDLCILYFFHFIISSLAARY